MPQFLVDPQNIHENCATLSPAEAKHLIKVLRYKKGDTLSVSDGQNRWRAVLSEVGPPSVQLKLLEKLPPPQRRPPPALGVALLKRDHLELVLQKGVELGVCDFYLFTSERTIPHFQKEAGAKKIARWEKIAAEAAKQSGLVGRPKIHPPMAFTELTRHFSRFSGVLLAWEEEFDADFSSTFQQIDSKNLLLLIGPEGGFTKEEVELACRAGAKKISLGSQILRSETAAITLLVLCQYELGNI